MMSMEAYTSFAEVYDLFMDNVPYEAWAGYLVSVLQEEGICDGIVMDLGCGTGKLTRLMAKAGYDMIGVDNSVDMLDIAREQELADDDCKELPGEEAADAETADEETAGSSILYLLQDMREFELYGTVRAIYSACDCMNYLLEEEDLLAVMKLANNYLDPRGLFIFDMNTPYKYEKILAENTFAENREDGSFIWENYFDPQTGINEYDLTLFIRAYDGEDNDGDPVFLRYVEEHYQKCYSLDTVKALLEKSGMEFVAAYDAYTKDGLRADSERMTIIARESGKLSR